jgi:adenylate cyclase
VNIASRLEAINKIYKTHMIVSKPVYEEAKHQFFFRLIDSVKVKGRSQSITIYEVLGNVLRHISFDLQAYNAEFEKGFSYYQQSQWLDAMIHFQQCIVIYPKDRIAPLFINIPQYCSYEVFEDAWLVLSY